jgi:glutathione S-transferase
MVPSFPERFRRIPLYGVPYSPSLGPSVQISLYWIPFSHPSQAVRKMLELKGLDFTEVSVLPLTQRVYLRAAGFAHGTVPALKLDRRRVQGSRQIARLLDELWPDPPLVPRDLAERSKVRKAERWGEEVLQPVPRRLARYGIAHSPEVRRWGAEARGLPAPGLVAAVSAPAARYYARLRERDGRRADEAGLRADFRLLPGLLDHADLLFEEGVLALDPPNAASLQVLASIRVLSAFADLRGLFERPCGQAARALFPVYPEPIPPFLSAPWLAALRTAVATPTR